MSTSAERTMLQKKKDSHQKNSTFLQVSPVLNFENLFCSVSAGAYPSKPSIWDPLLLFSPEMKLRNKAAMILEKGTSSFTIDPKEVTSYEVKSKDIFEKINRSLDGQYEDFQKEIQEANQQKISLR
jgi:hypothetical protein